MWHRIGWPLHSCIIGELACSRRYTEDVPMLISCLSQRFRRTAALQLVKTLVIKNEACWEAVWGNGDHASWAWPWAAVPQRAVTEMVR